MKRVTMLNWSGMNWNWKIQRYHEPTKDHMNTYCLIRCCMSNCLFNHIQQHRSTMCFYVYNIVAEIWDAFKIVKYAKAFVYFQSWSSNMESYLLRYLKMSLKMIQKLFEMADKENVLNDTFAKYIYIHSAFTASYLKKKTQINRKCKCCLLFDKTKIKWKYIKYSTLNINHLQISSSRFYDFALNITQLSAIFIVFKLYYYCTFNITFVVML